MGPELKINEEYVCPVIPLKDERDGAVGPDKIILFSMWPSNVPFIGKVSKLITLL